MVVALDLVSIGQAGVRWSVWLVGPDAKVDGVWRVPDQDFRVVVRREPVHGFVLREAGEHGGIGPRGFVQSSIDLYVPLEHWHHYVQLT